jgi:predicted permease
VDFWKDWSRDVRFGARLLAQQPAFTVLATLTLALGIGANTAIFTIFDALLLRSLPVREPGRLVLFNAAPNEGTSVGSPPVGRWRLFSYEIYEHLRKTPLPFESLAAFRSGETAVAVRVAGEASGAGAAERAQAHLVAGTYFNVMGVSAALGRTFGEDDDRPNAAPVAVVSDGFWKTRLHADPAVVGKVAIVNGTAFTIAGVTPAEFFGERVRRPADFWLPLAFQPQIELRPSFIDRRDAYWLNIVGRLTPDGTRAQAEAAATTALRQFLRNAEGAKLTPDRERQIQESRIELDDGAAGISGLRQAYSAPLRILLGVVLLVLLIACANVGNLLLARAAARRGEVSLRMALGATRTRIVRQLLVESLLLAAVGAACAIVLARWVVGALLALVVSPTAPVYATLNGRVLAATILVALVAGTLFGLAPAIDAGRVDLVSAMKSGHRGTPSSRGRFGATGILVAAQIAVSLVLLVGAGLFARSLFNLQQQPLGFDRDRVLVARLNPRLAGYKPADVGVLYRKLYDRLRALPGVASATLASYSPFGGSTTNESLTVEGYTPKPGENVETENLFVAPSYAETLGIQVVAGRTIGVADGPGAPLVAMVNEAFVRRYFAGANAIGRHFGFGDRADPKSYEIVGVLRDARFHNARDPVGPIAFAALQQETSQFALSADVAVRTTGDPATAVNELRQAIAEVDRNLPLNDPRPLAAQVAQSFDTERLAARLVSVFGALALVLACVGLYGVVSQGVARRTSEIGVRMALGAERRDVLWLILRETLALVAVGIAVGVPAAVGAARLVRSQLFGLGTADPASFVTAAAVLTVVAVAAGLFPARRASRVDPMVALRYE